MNAFSRLLRQVFVGGIFLTLLFGSGYLVYKRIFPTPPLPLCANGIQDAGEEGVDCGGICSKLCPPPPEVEKASVEWAKAVTSDVNMYDLVAKINNPNKFWGMKSYNYQFTVKDKNGAVIASSEGSSYLLPDGYDYVIAPSQKMETAPQDVSFKIFDEVWGNVTSGYGISAFSLPISQQQYSLKDENGFPSASGILGNKTPYDFERIDIKTVLYSAEGDLLGANISNMETMHQGEERYFRMIWNQAPVKSVAKIDFKAATNIFNSKNFMRLYGTDEKFNGYR